MLEVRNIHKNYPLRNISVLRDVSFRVQTGTTAALLGVVGSGKTTLMEIAAGVVRQDMGTIYYNGTEDKRLYREERMTIGYAPVRMRLYPEMTIRGYLKHILNMKRVPRKSHPEYLERALEAIDMQDSRDRLIQTLTIFEQQKLKIAQAICGETKFLLLDEPTYMLKAGESAQMREIIGKILREGDYTTLISTQVLGEAKDLADQILMINNGKIVINTQLNEIEKAQSMLRLKIVPGVGQQDEFLADLRRSAEVDVMPNLEKNYLGMHLHYPKGMDFREFVWEKSVQYHVPILEMRQQNVSLEEMYLQITSDNI